MSTPTPLKQFVNAVEAGEILGINENSIYLLIQEGMLPAAKIGKKWMLRNEDVVNYLTAQIDEQTRMRKARLDQIQNPATLPTIMRRRAPRRSTALIENLASDR